MPRRISTNGTVPPLLLLLLLPPHSDVIVDARKALVDRDWWRRFVNMYEWAVAVGR